MTVEKNEFFGRTALVAGAEMMERMADTSVIIFGLGGVGSWCAEALVRCGIGRITLVDPDAVAASNVNRQLPALTSTIGRPKIEVLAERFSQINPDISLSLRIEPYTAESAASFGISAYDYAIDAIDSLADKAALILESTDPVTAPERAF